MSYLRYLISTISELPLIESALGPSSSAGSSIAMKSIQRGTVRIVSLRSSRSLGLRLYSTRPETREPDASTHFGFQTVPASKKEELGSDNLVY